MTPPSGPPPLVSVCISTYNQEKFIAAAIDSVLMQEVRFPYELVIAEDCSTDGTRRIIQEYQARHPDRIRLILREKNVGASLNYIGLIEAATGRYVASLDGDDYWNQPWKLQKQVDFLESHPECAGCFHDALVRYEDGRPSHPYGITTKKPIYTIEDLLATCMIPSCSTMFRNGLFGKFPDWYPQQVCGDWALHVLNAQHGHYGYLDEVLGTYRIHAGGIWSSGSYISGESAVHDRRLKALLQFYAIINRHLGYRYDALIRRREALLWYDWVWLAQCDEDWSAMRRYLLKAARCCLLPPRKRPGEVARFYVAAFCPALYRLGRKWLRGADRGPRASPAASAARLPPS